MEASTTDIPSPAEEAAASLDDNDRAPKRARTAADLKARALHRDVVLPSGSIVDLRVPNLPMMIKAGKIPNDLIDLALKADQADAITKELIIETWDFTKFILPLTVVNPEITEDDVDGLDTLDIELLLNIATRRADTDAVGRQLGGLDTQEAFREFRQQRDLRAILGGL